MNFAKVAKDSIRLTCYIIGDESLVIQCAQVLITKGYLILGIISDNLSIQQWAHEHSIPMVEITVLKEAVPYDYLFSIVNHSTLNSQIIKQPRYFAINYHDALLPHYAGVHATSWAILNAEKEQGVTWHIMTETIDGGDILKQTTFELASDETAFSLNIKCYEVAIKLFSELTDELLNNTYVRRLQDISQRTYYGKHQKPKGNIITDWNLSAEFIDRMYRAMNFGSSINRFATLKIKIQDQLFIIQHLQITTKLSTQLPGIIVDFTDNSLSISTTTYDINITKISSLSGHHFPMSKLNLTIGMNINSQNLFFSKNFEELEWDQRLSRFEKFWIDQFLLPICERMPYFVPDFIDLKYSKQKCLINFSISESFLRNPNICAASKQDRFIALLYLYFYRLMQQNTICLDYSSDKLKAQAKKLFSLVGNWIPLNITLKSHSSFDEVTKAINTQQDLILSHEIYLQDIFARYPALNSQVKPFPFGIYIINNANNAHKNFILSSANAITFVIDSDLKKIGIYVNKKIKNKNFYAYCMKIPDHLVTLAEAIEKDPTRSIDYLPLLNPIEYQTIIYQWNNTITHYPFNKTVHALFDKQVKHNPHHIAITDGSLTYTYSQLNQKANQLAHYLIDQGIKAQDFIAVCMDRCANFIISILAIIKTGAVYVPIDTEYPPSRINYILNDCKAKFLLVNSYHPHIKMEQCQLIDLSSIDHELTHFTTDDLPESVNALSLIYVLYTSGTTGHPKGVLIKHQSVVRLVKNTNYIVISKHDKVGHLTNIAFDVSTFEIWGALLNGAVLVLLNKDLLETTADFEKALIENKITILWLTTSLFNYFICNKSINFSLLKYLIIGGEALNPKLISKLFNHEATQPQHVMNGYGPTENTVFSTYYLITKKDVKGKILSIPIGKPIANTQAYVVDHNLQPLPIGAMGELCLGGEGLSVGYLNLPEMTMQKFLANPFNKSSAHQIYSQQMTESAHEFCNKAENPLAKHIYRTGDLARWLPNGNLDYQGRIDDQIKIRGYRIQLKEIEAILCMHPDINEAVVIVDENTKRQKQLKAFYTYIPSLNIALDDKLIKKFLKIHLPSYMIPNQLIAVKKIPLAENGKVNRELLLQNKSNQKIHRLFEPSPIEKILLKIWRNVLQQNSMTIHDDFFELGGDSIIAMQILSHVSKYGIKFRVKDIFQYPSIEKLAKVIQLSIQEHNIAIQPKPFNLTPIQLWFFEKNFQEYNYFSHACLVKLTTPIKIDLLEQAFQFLLKQHDALRMHFTMSDNYLNQYYKNYHPYKVVDQVISDNDFIKNTLPQLQNQLNINQGPLLKAALYQPISNEQWQLLIVIHHLVIDGISWRILLDDLQLFYNQLSENKPLIFPSKTASFQTWRHELSNYVNHHHLLSELDYWQKLCEKKFIIPTEQDDNQHDKLNLEQHAVTKEVILSEDETTLLKKRLPLQYGLKIQEVLLTALVDVIQRWAGTKNILIDLEHHGRNSLDINTSHTMGWFTNIFPISLTCESEDIFENLFAIKNQLDVVPNHGIGYGLLRYFMKQPKLIDQAQISFNYWGQFEQFETETHKIFEFQWLKLISSPHNQRTHLFNIDIAIHQNKLHINWTYNLHYHKKNTINKLVNTFLTILRKIITFSIKDQVHPTIGDSYPLSAIQQGILFHTIANPTSEAYMTQLVSPEIKKLQPKILYRAWQILIDRHPILRTAFNWRNPNELRQLIYKDTKANWYHYDWSNMSAAEKINRLKSLLKSDRQAGFDLQKPPLIRTHVIKLTQKKYQLFVTAYHGILDGWSLPILFNELQIIYLSIFKKNLQTLLLKKYPPYRNFIEWLQNKELNNAKNFWSSYLKGFKEPIHLGLIEKNQASNLEKNSDDYSLVSTHLTDAFYQRIKKFCKTQQLTLNTLIQGTWALILSRYSQNTDVVFGITMTCRTDELEGSDQIIGPLINTVPMRVNLAKVITVLEYLQALQVNSISLIPFAFTPLTYVHQCSEIAAGKSLFENILIFENYPNENFEGAFVKFNELTIYDPTHYPLSLSIFPSNHLKLNIYYNKKLIPPIWAERLLSHLETTLNELISHPNEKIQKINILTIAEKQKILKTFNQTNYPIPLHNNIVNLIESQVEKTPNEIAVVFKDQYLSYFKLNQQMNQLALFLKNKGIQNGILVGVCLEHSINLIIAILGVLKAGGVYLPLDPAYPAERINYIIHNSQLKLILSESSIAEDLKNNDIQLNNCLLLDQLNFQQENMQKCNLNINSDQIINVIYTSGSTGNPKGVMNTHIGILNRLLWMQNAYQLNKTDAVLQKTSFCFDVSVWELFLPLITGAKLVFSSSKMHKNLQYIINIIQKYKITTLHFVPSLFAEFLKQDMVSSCSSIKRIVCSGEVLPISLAQKFYQIFPYSNLYNLYGPTEAAIDTTAWDCSQIHQYSKVLIGKPISNMQIYILDPYLNPVPIGIKGEIYIGGIGLAKGYLHNPVLTNERFIPNPFDPNHTSKLYKTGDLGQWLPDGNIQYHDRIDNQVKIRGFRVELGEIEAKLHAYPNVQQAVVLLSRPPSLNAILVAYIKLKNPTHAIDMRTLKHFLKKFLPDYMIPTQYHLVNDMPLLPNGKIDRKQLFHIKGAHVLSVSHQGRTPQNGDEKQIAAIWKIVLGIDEVTVEDNFFDLGGHSLAILQVIGHIKLKYNFELAISTFYQNPTILGIVDTITTKKLEQTAFAVATQKVQKFHCLIPFRSQGTKRPLFLVHPIGGTVFWYIPLAKYFTSDFPFYGIQDPGIETKKIPFDTVEEMAEFYIKTIRNVQPHGPYALGGASGGATISIEMARQLNQVGEEVTFLALLDGWAPYPNVLVHKEFFEATMRRQYVTMQNQFYLKGIHSADDLLKLQWTRSQQMNAYKIPFIHTPITLFKAQETIPIYQPLEAPLNHWEHYTNKKIECFIVPGTHESMFSEPHVKVLANLLLISSEP